MRLDTSRATLILRVLQAIFAIVVLGLTGYGKFSLPSTLPLQSKKLTPLPPIVAHWWSSYWHTSSPPQISFLLFTAIWTLLALTYLLIIPHRFSNTLLADPKLVLAVEAVTMLFWFAGFVALAVFLADRVCFGRVCAAAKAAAVFGGFAWYVTNPYPLG